MLEASCGSSFAKRDADNEADIFAEREKLGEIETIGARPAQRNGLVAMIAEDGNAVNSLVPSWETNRDYS